MTPLSGALPKGYIGKGKPRERLKPGQRMRNYLRKEGAVSKRYERNARQPFLLKRFAENDGWTRCDHCQGPIILTRNGVGPVQTGPNVQVHHVVARGSEPSQREDQGNLRLLHDPCHLRFKYDKHGELWRKLHPNS